MTGCFLCVFRVPFLLSFLMTSFLWSSSLVDPEAAIGLPSGFAADSASDLFLSQWKSEALDSLFCLLPALVYSLIAP